MRKKPVVVAVMSSIVTLIARFLLSISCLAKRRSGSSWCARTMSPIRSSGARWASCWDLPSSKATRSRSCSTATRSFLDARPDGDHRNAPDDPIVERLLRARRADCQGAGRRRQARRFRANHHARHRHRCGSGAFRFARVVGRPAAFSPASKSPSTSRQCSTSRRWSSTT